MISEFGLKVKKAGCVLALLVVIRNFPQPVLYLITIVLRSPAISITIIAFILGCLRMYRQNFGVIAYFCSLSNQLVSRFRTLAEKYRLLTIMRIASPPFSMAYMPREIIFYYCVNLCVFENSKSFTWLFSFLSYGIIRNFIKMAFIQKQPQMLYRMYCTVSMATVVTFMVIRYGMAYFTVTLCYYLTLDDSLVGYFVIVVRSKDFDCLEGLEQCYVSLASSVIQMVLGFGILALLLTSSFLYAVMNLIAVIVCAYKVFYPAVTEARRSYKVLQCFRRLLNGFSRASPADLKMLNDVCAICLGEMKAARVTPCRHYFHGKCLLRCLQDNPLCPMCKSRLTRLVLSRRE